jgi:cell division protein FtsL
MQNQNENQTQTTPAAIGTSEDSPQQAPKKKFGSITTNKKTLIIAIAAVVVVASVSYVFLRSSVKNNTSQNSQKPSSLQVVKNKNASTANATAVTDNTYFDMPKKLSDLKFFKNTDAFGQSCPGVNGTECAPSIPLSDISYYQIGTTKDNKKIVVIVMPGGIDTIEAFALEKANGTYEVLGQMSPTFSDNQAPAVKSFNPNVGINQSIILNDVTFPVNATLNSQKIKTDYKDPSIGNSNFMEKGLTSIRGIFYGETKYGAPSKIASKGNLDYYEVTAGDDPTFQVKEIYGVFKQLFSVAYIPNDEISSTNDKLAVNWASGEKNSSIYFSGGQGCGSRGYITAKNITKSKLTSVGKTPGGQIVYQLALNDPLVQEIYTKDYDKGNSLDNASLKNFTLQQFSDKHSYFLAQNGLGEYVVYQRDDLFIRGGCAKPVIYLYPKTDTKVSVAVGAQITKSTPSYGGTGWQNTIAHPDGSLTYKGQVFPYLFWEGYGSGAYPIVNYGTIVKSNEAIATVQNQLVQQGLNQKEIHDFMDFWGAKLNTGKPYIRISWLNTGQMNRLAPLYISPKPSTSIRVFLDFEGIDRPYSLQPQKLSAPERTGFTMVEWGGLMRDGLNKLAE